MWSRWHNHVASAFASSLSAKQWKYLKFHISNIKVHDKNNTLTSCLSCLDFEHVTVGSHPLTHSLAHTPLSQQLAPRTRSHSLTHSLTQSLPLSLSHFLSLSLSHSLTHSLTQQLLLLLLLLLLFLLLFLFLFVSFLWWRTAYRPGFSRNSSPSPQASLFFKTWPLPCLAAVAIKHGHCHSNAERYHAQRLHSDRHGVFRVGWLVGTVFLPFSNTWTF